MIRYNIDNDGEEYEDKNGKFILFEDHRKIFQNLSPSTQMEILDTVKSELASTQYDFSFWNDKDSPSGRDMQRWINALKAMQNSLMDIWE